MPRLTKEEVQEKISRYIDQALQGISNEEPKLDYKRQYHNLKDNKSKSKFLKLVTAIANTLGEHGFIIYGFDPDDKTKQFFYLPKFSDSGLKDDNELIGFIVKNVSHSFDVERYPIEYKGHNLEVLYIPATNEKPYLVRSMHSNGGIPQFNQTFIRKGTTTKNANKGDIDTMYYYRGIEGNIIPDYKVEVGVSHSEIKYGHLQHNLLTANYFGRLELTFENLGKRIICIKELQLICISVNDERFILNIDKSVNSAWTGKQFPISELSIKKDELKLMFCGIKSQKKDFKLTEQGKASWKYFIKIQLTNNKELLIQLETLNVIDTKVKVNNFGRSV